MFRNYHWCSLNWPGACANSMARPTDEWPTSDGHLHIGCSSARLCAGKKELVKNQSYQERMRPHHPKSGICFCGLCSYVQTSGRGWHTLYHFCNACPIKIDPILSGGFQKRGGHSSLMRQTGYNILTHSHHGINGCCKRDDGSVWSERLPTVQ